MTLSPRIHSVEVPRTARYATLGDPSSAREWWIVLHGYGQLAADFIESFVALASDNRCVIAPEGLSRFYTDDLGEHQKVGASWMTREAREDEIRDYVRALDGVVGAAAPRGPESVSVLGFSQGTATASRWAVYGDTDVDRLLLWGGPPARDIDLDAHRDTLCSMDLALILGTDDPHVPADIREAVLDRLRTAEIPVELYRYEGGHRIVQEALQRILTEELGMADLD